mgnify:CR=1 FL=1
MDLKTYLSEYGRQALLAKHLDVSASEVNQWKSGARSVPAPHCPAIEQWSEGAITRRDLRPKDWHRIWPELVTPDHPAPVEEAA